MVEYLTLEVGFTSSACGEDDIIYERIGGGRVMTPFILRTEASADRWRSINRIEVKGHKLAKAPYSL